MGLDHAGLPPPLHGQLQSAPQRKYPQSLTARAEIVVKRVLTPDHNHMLTHKLHKTLRRVDVGTCEFKQVTNVEHKEFMIRSR